MANTLARADRPEASRTASWMPFRDLFGFDPFGSMRGLEYEVTRTENGYQVDIPVPGFKPENVEVTYQDEVIAVSAKAERRSFARSFTVPKTSIPRGSRLAWPTECSC